MDYDELFKAFREEEVKTKHLIKKAEEKKATRKAKHDKRVTLEHIRVQMVRDITYDIKSLRQRNAKDCDTVAFINKVFSRVRQAISE